MKHQEVLEIQFFWSFVAVTDTCSRHDSSYIIAVQFQLYISQVKHEATESAENQAMIQIIYIIDIV